MAREEGQCETIDKKDAHMRAWILIGSRNSGLATITRHLSGLGRDAETDE